MPEARKIPLPIATGIILNKTEYEAQGRYIDCDHIRFVDGQPEKIGGWEQWNTPGDELTGICRSTRFWQDFNYNVWHAFGTSARLWIYDQEKTRTNITPYEATGTLANPFSTTDTLTTVNVADTAHGLVVGQYVNFSGASAVGGITIDGEYTVTAVVDANNYTITHSSAATSTAGPGGGASVAYSYELEPGTANVTTGGGWGLGRWGESTWGTERTTVAYVTLPRFWSLDGYGQDLLALPSGGTLYRWQRNVNNRAAAVSNAPSTALYMFVTSERIVVMLGTGGDLMQMEWCDDDDITLWTPADDNTANIRRLQEGSRLIAGTRLAQAVNLVWSDTAVYLMQFTANNNVYSTRVVGTNCGLIGPAAFAVVDGIAFWMAPTTFHMYGGQLSHLPRSDEIEAIFDEINPEQRFKVTAFFNPEHRELWWLYPSTGSTECDKYVMVNLDSWDWVTGTLDRTAVGLLNLLGKYTILATDESGVIYEHEVGVDDDGAALDWHLESGFMDLEDGNAGIDIDGYIPDFKTQVGTIDLTFTSLDMPEDTATLDTVTKEIAQGDTVVDLRHFGRQSKVELSQTGVVGGNFRLGAQRLEVRGVPTKRHD
jgi:hypothetical protein